MWYQKKSRRRRQSGMLLLAIFVSAAICLMSGEQSDTETTGDRLLSLAKNRLGMETTNSILPIMTYQPPDSGMTLASCLADSMDQLLPIYGYVRKRHTGAAMAGIYEEDSCDNPADSLTRELLAQENSKGMEPEKQEEEKEDIQTVRASSGEENAKSYSIEKLSDFDYLLQHFYRVDSTTTISSDRLNARRMLEQDMSVDRTKKGPQILIYHTHSQEAFADSKDSTQTVVGLGDILTKLLEDAGYEVLHHTGEYDVPSRDAAYSRAAPALENLLKKYPDIQVIIDLHRDGVAEQTRLVEEINGKKTATIMFFNGLSHTTAQGDISYLRNENLDGNLAFSFQMQLTAARYYPGFSRCIYLKGYRYNLQYLPKSLLVEVGAQTNTYQEAVNAMAPLADVLDKVLSGEEPQGYNSAP